MNNQHKTVLVIGDSAQSGEPLAHLLQECGYQVLAEESIDEALEAMSDFTGRARPSLIMCDLNQAPGDPAMLGFIRKELDVEVIGFGENATSQATINIKTLSKRPGNVAQMSRLVTGTLSRSAKTLNRNAKAA